VIPSLCLTDGIVTCPRAGFEISQRCPENYKHLIQECINHGWIKASGTCIWKRTNNGCNEMTNPFRDQEKFMKACDQTTGGEFDLEQFNMYLGLIEEEYKELQVAIKTTIN
jgi:hypothetical protein